MQGVPRVCAPCVRVRLCGLLVVLCGYVKGVLGVGVLPIPGDPRASVGAAACYSPTPCRVQYHRRAGP